MKNIVCCGMQNGDEGKGSFIDWLTHISDAECIVKYNGGSQASHTVITPDGTSHKFSQLGSGMFKEGCHTYITEEMIINPDNLLREAQVFASNMGEELNDVLERIHIHENCWIVTPYHKLMNNLRELSLGNDRRGSVGTGVSEVPLFRLNKLGPYHKGLGVQIADIFDAVLWGSFSDMYDYVKEFYDENNDTIWGNCPDDLKPELQKMIETLLSREAAYQIARKYSDIYRTGDGRKLKRCLYSTYEKTIRKLNTAVWEGSQGFLIDKDYGISPNTTCLKTTNEPAMDLMYLKDDIVKVGIINAFCSRHGMGVFPTEDKALNIKDKQDESFWNGSPRHGWFDMVLYKYASNINDPDIVCMSSIDKLNGCDIIKVCLCYEYIGEIDEEFSSTFDFSISNSKKILILKIKQNHPRMKEWLEKCTPVYEEVKGWDNLEKVTDKESLMEKCSAFINLMLQLIPKLTVISTGPTRNNKIIINEELAKKIIKK